MPLFPSVLALALIGYFGVSYAAPAQNDANCTAHFYLQWESVFWFVLWFQCLPGSFWKRMELLSRGLKELSDFGF